MTAQAKLFTHIMLGIAAALFLAGIWTGDERWPSSGGIVLAFGMIPAISGFIRGPL